MIGRRDLLALASAAGAAALCPRIVFSQQAKVPRIAFVWPKGFVDIPPFFDGLADFGYVDGKTAAITSFIAPTQDDASAAIAAAVASRPDIILVPSPPFAIAAKNATSTIPVVFGIIADPVGLGLIQNLTHPGGNLTGTATLGLEGIGKQLAIAKEAIPTATRLVALVTPLSATTSRATPQIEAAAKALGMESVIIDFVDGPDFAAQFERVVAAAPQVVWIQGDVYFNSRFSLLADLQIKYRLPMIAGNNSAVSSGVMLGYGASTAAIARRTGAYVDAILKGSRPGDLPVEQPTVFDLLINLATAKALRITIPPSILAQATIVIE